LTIGRILPPYLEIRGPTAKDRKMIDVFFKQKFPGPTLRIEESSH